MQRPTLLLCQLWRVSCQQCPPLLLRRTRQQHNISVFQQRLLIHTSRFPKAKQQQLQQQQTTNNKQHKAASTKRAHFLCVLRHLARRPLAIDMMNVERAGGAQRRRGRRLRAALRLERQSIAMVLAEKLHHTSRGHKIAGAREEEENEMNFTMGQRTLLPRAAAAEYFPAILAASRGVYRTCRVFRCSCASLGGCRACSVLRCSCTCC